jgi:hypothetical protein
MGRWSYLVRFGLGRGAGTNAAIHAHCESVGSVPYPLRSHGYHDAMTSCISHEVTSKHPLKRLRLIYAGMCPPCNKWLSRHEEYFVNNVSLPQGRSEPLVLPDVERVTLKIDSYSSTARRWGVVTGVLGLSMSLSPIDTPRCHSEICEHRRDSVRAVALTRRLTLALRRSACRRSGPRR